jgi:hypothetical protein
MRYELDVAGANMKKATFKLIIVNTLVLVKFFQAS